MYKIKTRGSNTGSGLLYKICGKTQYKGNVRFPISSVSRPIYENKQQVDIIEQSFNDTYKPRGKRTKFLKVKEEKQDIVQELMQKSLK